MGMAQVHIVSGPTSSGKSTYIDEHRAEYDEIVLGNRVPRISIEPGRRYAIHYNVLRPLGRVYRLTGERSVISKVRGWRIARRVDTHGLFERDEILTRVDAFEAEKRATVIVVGREELERRIRERIRREPLRAQEARYQNEQWLAVLEKVDLDRMYEEWIGYLKDRSIPTELVVSRDGGFEPVAVS